MWNSFLGKCLVSGSAQTVRRYALFIKPAPDLVPTLTTPELIAAVTRKSGAASEYGSPSTIQDTLRDRTKLMQLLPESQNELPPRRMQDSFISAVVPLSTNSELRERYVNYFGGVRAGRILEDLDVFAVSCCYKHIQNPRAEGKPSPYSIVTALVDCISFSGEFFQTHQDIRISGHVSYVGKSSMEVSVQVDQTNRDGSIVLLMNAIFVMVARDPLNNGSALVNQLLVETNQEKAYLAEGGERNLKRKKSSQESLTKKAPSEEERELVHKLFQSTMHASYEGFRPFKEIHALQPPNTRLMKECRLNTLMVCHPQYRNRFGKIFGGFIMRQAYELAFSNAFLYTKSRPKIVNIDDIIFRKPVEIGSILRFGAEIGYVEGKYVHTPVIAEVLNPETGESDVTNIFQFTFLSTNDTDPPALIPYTYQEAMMYLNARRHFKGMMPTTTKEL